MPKVRFELSLMSGSKLMPKAQVRLSSVDHYFYLMLISRHTFGKDHKKYPEKKGQKDAFVLSEGYNEATLILHLFKSRWHIPNTVCSQSA